MPNQNLSLRGIDLVTLRVLLAALEEGNLARVADREGIAISAVSRRISDLEARLGVKLLHRHDRGVRPTAAADSLRPRIRAMFDLLAQIVDEARQVSTGMRGLVRVQAHMTAAAGSLYKQVASFLARNPSVDVELDEATSLDILHAVRTGTCDVGLVSGTVDPGDLHLTPWAQDELVAVLPPESPLGAKPELRLSDLLDAPFIGMQRDSALLSLYRSQAAAMGRVLRERAHATSFEAVRRMVGLGLGVSILPAAAALSFAEPGGVAVRPLAESWALRPLMLCVREPAQLSAAARLLMDHLAAVEEAPQASPHSRGEGA